MAYFRGQAPVGQTVTIRAVFRDGANNVIDVDPGYPNVHIYPPSVSQDAIDSAIASGDFSGATETILAASVTRISEGFYEASWTVPATADIGGWTDVWEAEISGVDVTDSFNIEVVSVGSVSIQSIDRNTLIVITISEDVLDVDGNSLGEETYLTFSTTYDPYYASPDLVRLECGSWLDSIPDDTISLMIHWSSIEADIIATAKNTGRLFNAARTKFVIYDAALRSLMIPVNMGGKQKQLGDLMIKNDSTFVEVIGELKKKREEWFRVVNAKGTIVPGQSFAPAVASKGRFDPDRSRMGRQWWPPTDFPYLQPGANAKIRKVNQRKFKKGFYDGGPEEP